MQALILAGGSGTRFWPLSRRQRPKQLLNLEGERSLLQATVDRLAPLISPAETWVCTTRRLADAVRQQLPEVPAEQILAEPEGRNTAPAIGWALQQMPEEARRGVVAVLPADHRFGNAAAFRDALQGAAEEVERSDRVVALGVTPRWPETGYGYLELGPQEGESAGVRKISRFTEKPDLETATAWVAAGSHLWNAGIFIFRGSTLLAELARFEPEIGSGLAKIAESPELTTEVYLQMPSISIDYAVMERLDSMLSVALDGADGSSTDGSGTASSGPEASNGDSGWSDLGSWEALSEILPADADGNRRRGDVLAIDARDNLLFADEGTVAVVGVEGLAVVKTGDSVLVIPRARSQEVRRIVSELRRDERDDLL